MGLLDDLCFRVRRLYVVYELHTVINLLEVFIYQKVQVNRLVHLMIVRLNIRGCDLTISIEKILETIAACNSKESGVLIIQLLQVCVFGGVYYLVVEIFVHCARIIVDYPSFIMLKLELFS